MDFNFKPSFDRIYKKLPISERSAVDTKIKDLFAYYNKSVFVAGLKVRKISGRVDHFEIDTASNRRLLIRKHRSLIEFIAYGNHDEVKRFLRSIK